MSQNESDNKTPNRKPHKVKPIGAYGHRERMYERFLSSMDTGINPRDLVEMLLYYPIRIRDTRDSAVILMEHNNGDIRRILDADTKSLCDVDGIGASCAQFLNIAGEAVHRLENRVVDNEQLCDAEIIEDVFIKNYTYSGENEVWIARFDASGRLISTVNTGLDYKSVSPEDIMSISHLQLQNRISAIAFAHFTAEPESLPDHYDVKLADLILVAMEFSNLTLIDYYVVNGEEAISLLANR